MTGRDLILYILENHLEDKQVFEEGNLLGFITIIEAAEKMSVGVATILTWLNQGRLKGVTIGDTIYIPASSKSPMEEETCVVKQEDC